MAYRYVLSNKLIIQSNLIPCAHICRYCSISSDGLRSHGGIELTRFFELVDRFSAWGQSTGFEISDVVHSSDDITDEVAAFLDQTIGRPDGTIRPYALPAEARLRIGVVRTGGARMRSDEEIRSWLGRWREAGSTSVHASFAGHGAIHDWWNRRSGDYDFLLRIQQIAAEMEFKLSQTVFLARNTLHSIVALLADLDRIPVRPESRRAFPPAYLGRACDETVDAQRLTECERDSLPEAILRIPDLSIGDWRSEREWLQERSAWGDEVRKLDLILNVDRRNIAVLEHLSVDAIVERLADEAAKAYGQIPSQEDLVASFGDASCKKIYTRFDEVERRCFHRWMEDQRIPLEMRNIHF